MNKPIFLATAFLSCFAFSCMYTSKSEPETRAALKEGTWRVVMALPDAELPFNLQVSKADSGYTFMVINDAEKIPITDISVRGDSFFISMPVFQSELIGKITGDTVLTGFWYNYSKCDDYKIPIKAVHGQSFRFPNSSEGVSANVSGKWEVTFSEDTEDSCKAIGIFNQTENRLSGTFLTETGDYRFLDGNIVNDSIFLSCFDGSHAFLFKALYSAGRIQGQFWSGNHWKESWVAFRNDDFKLSDPDSLTYLLDGYEGLSFSFPDLDSHIVSLNDEKYLNKTLIVQIMGSWCPNCADETAFLSELYKRYHSDGLEVIALAYEKSDKFSKAVKAVKKMKDHFDADYDFLIAGKANKKEAIKTLPMLNHIMSYPTCIFIDKNKKIRKIRTGFYGPGTGDFYEHNIREMTEFTEMLLGKTPG